MPECDVETVRVWVRPKDKSVYHVDSLLPTKLAFARAHQLRKLDEVAWAYCDEPRDLARLDPEAPGDAA